MPYDSTGYHPRWVTPCVDLWGRTQRILIAPRDTESRPDPDRRLFINAPPSGALLTLDEAEQIADDLRAVVRTLRQPRTPPRG